MIFTNLLANMIVLGLSGEIPTNTPAFQAYVRSAMFSNVQEVASRLRLNQELITTNTITRFHATPYPNGYSALIEFSGRYKFWLREGEWGSFSDEAYCWRDVCVATNGQWQIDYNLRHAGEGEQQSDEGYRLWIAAVDGDEKKSQAIAERWASATNLLTFRKARRIAESAVRSLGVPTKGAGLRIKWKVKGEQMIWEQAPPSVFLPPEALTRRDGRIVAITGLPANAGDVGGVVGPLSDGGWCVTYKYKREYQKKLTLPYYKFEWKGADGFPVCYVEVSGITGTIAYLEYYGPGAQVGKPTDYLELLGLPANAVFVRPRFTVPRTYETVP